MSDTQSNRTLLGRIEAQLNSSRLRENLGALFIDVLRWATPPAATQSVPVGAPVSRTLTLVPIAQLGQVPVYRLDWESDKPPTLTQRRAVHRALKPVAVEHLLCYVTADGQQASLVWARPRGKGNNGQAQKVELRSLPYEVGSLARTTIERLAELAFSFEDYLFGEPQVSAMTDKLNRAFDVEAVTKAFFEGYKAVFDDLKERLTGQTGDQSWAHDYALQLLNRVMFLYFVQRKRWLGNDPGFMRTFWDAYRASGRRKDTFYDDWLSVLFFEAFCNGFQAGRQDRQHLPEHLRQTLALAPYLNGGLFTRNELDQDYTVAVNDALFTTLFDQFQGSTPGLFERFNFAISESSPFDLEVAVDPEMIGKVYESLVKEASEDGDGQHEAGIYYTPRVEIDLMCRLSLVDWLTNHLGQDHQNLLYEAVFAYDLEDKEAADRHLAQANLWPRLEDLLRNVTVLDPACGSGSFLVGMLSVLDDLLARADDQLGREETPYERKKRIVGNSLYGVDVMDWAVHVAELRLWLQLIIDTELAPAELKFRPLLPNLSFKVRPGDSLVQEVGGINLALRKGSGLIPPHIKGQITRLQGEKRKFYNNQPDRKYRTEGQLRQAEFEVFRDLLEERLKAIADRLKEIANALRPQVNLFGEVDQPQMALDRVALERERDDLDVQREQVTRARQALHTAQNVPFVWDIAFVEIFGGDQRGFDLVMGNPPYLRQEQIHDPRYRLSKTTAAQRKAYKDKLAQSVYAIWPNAFGYDWAKGAARDKLDAKSDLYIYFYLHGLSLLNDRGSFCFITSNAWLDVGYGADLQRFLLTRGKVKLVIDNQGRRSFSGADVNTVIVLLGAPQDTRAQRKESLAHTARFLMLTVPFEQTLSPVIWEEVAESCARCSTPEYRFHPARQAELLLEGMDPDRREYTGDKWGGKYLRAPDIYWTILEKGKGKLVRLGDIAEVRFGIKTGANEFFYLDEERIRQWGIEEEFLRPVLRCPKECLSILLNPEEFKYRVFLCNRPKEELQGTAALAYIRYGEQQGFDEAPTCSSRRHWYALGDPHPTQIAAKMTTKYRHYFPVSPDPILVDARFYEIRPRTVSPQALAASLNCSLTGLFLEPLGRYIGGGGGPLDLTVYEARQLMVISPETSGAGATFWSNDMLRRPVLHVWKELELPDRRAFDSMFFDVLGLTQGERDAVYEAVIALVEARLKKAQSV